MFLFSSKGEKLNKLSKICRDWGRVVSLLRGQSILFSPFCGHIQCEEWIESNLQSNGINNVRLINIPLDQPARIDYFDKCINPKCREKPFFLLCLAILFFEDFWLLGCLVQ